jgi:hypothetical protein
MIDRRFQDTSRFSSLFCDRIILLENLNKVETLNSYLSYVTLFEDLLEGELMKRKIDGTQFKSMRHIYLGCFRKGLLHGMRNIISTLRSKAQKHETYDDRKKRR